MTDATKKTRIVISTGGLHCGKYEPSEETLRKLKGVIVDAVGKQLRGEAGPSEPWPFDPVLPIKGSSEDSAE